MIDLSMACNKPRAWSSALAIVPSMWRLREDWQRLHARLQHNILLWIGSQRLDEDNHTNTDTHRHVGGSTENAGPENGGPKRWKNWKCRIENEGPNVRGGKWQDGKTLQQVMLVGWTFTRTLTPVLMKLNGSLWLRLYNEKSDIIRPYYSLTQRSRSTSSTMHCVVCKLNVSTRALRPYHCQNTPTDRLL